MKQLIASFLLIATLAFGTADVFAGQRNGRRGYTQRSNYGRDYGYDRSRNYDDYRDDRSIWDKHRDKITTAAGALGGAAVGGAVGGKKGALIGAIAGGVGSAIYTYKIRKKNDRRY